MPRQHPAQPVIIMMTMFAICIIMKLVSSSQRSVIYNMHIVVHGKMTPRRGSYMVSLTINVVCVSQQRCHETIIIHVNSFVTHLRNRMLQA
jgi:hypothetical protein